MKKIHIAFATDLFYLKPTCVALESVLLASVSNEFIYCFYVLMPAEETDVVASYFARIKNRYENCEIKVIGIADVFEDAYLPMAHFTKPSFYRLLLPRLIEQERCIYLDSDIIVCRDLSKLYDIDMNGYLIGGALSPAYVNEKGYADKIGIPSTSHYINSGVLLLNLEKMRQDNFVEHALELIEMPFSYPDQDIINRVAYQNIKVLPYKYNVRPTLERYPDIISDLEVEEANKNPKILHYIYPEKPWECFDIEWANKWWEICGKSLFFNDFLEEQKGSLFYYGVVMHMELWKLEKYSPKWFNEIKKYKACYVYGAGKIGEGAVLCMKHNDISITGILVSDLSENKKCVQEIAVKELTEDIEKDALILVAVSRKYQLPIRRKLFEHGLFYVMPVAEIVDVKSWES